MNKRLTISKALLQRASEVARKQGVVVEIERGDVTVKVYPTEEQEQKPEEW